MKETTKNVTMAFQTPLKPPASPTDSNNDINPPLQQQVQDLMSQLALKRQTEEQLQAQLQQFQSLLAANKVSTAAEVQERLAHWRQKSVEEAVARRVVFEQHTANREQLDTWLHEQYLMQVYQAQDCDVCDSTDQGVQTFSITKEGLAQTHELQMLSAQLHFNLRNEVAKGQVLRDRYAALQQSAEKMKVELRDCREGYKAMQLTAETAQANATAKELEVQELQAELEGLKLQVAQQEETCTQLLTLLQAANIIPVEHEGTPRSGDTADSGCHWDFSALLKASLQRLKATEHHDNTLQQELEQEQQQGQNSLEAQEQEEQQEQEQERRDNPSPATTVHTRHPWDLQLDPLQQGINKSRQSFSSIGSSDTVCCELAGWSQLQLVPLTSNTCLLPALGTTPRPTEGPTAAAAAEEEAAVMEWLRGSLNTACCYDKCEKKENSDDNKSGLFTADATGDCCSDNESHISAVELLEVRRQPEETPDELAPLAAELMQRLSAASCTLKAREAEVASLKAQIDLLRQQVEQQQLQLEVCYSGGQGSGGMNLCLVWSEGEEEEGEVVSALIEEY